MGKSIFPFTPTQDTIQAPSKMVFKVAGEVFWKILLSISLIFLDISHAAFGRKEIEIAEVNQHL